MLRSLKYWDYGQQKIVGAGFPHPVLEGDETSPLQLVSSSEVSTRQLFL